MLYYGFDREQNNISHPQIGGCRWAFWYFTDIYMPISVNVISTANVLHIHTLSIHQAMGKGRVFRIVGFE